MKTRSSGILLHPTSLPSAYGAGDLGPEALKFAETLARAGQSCWQILPLTPTSPALGDSPYAGFTAFGGNPLLVSPDLLVADGLLTERDIHGLAQEHLGETEGENPWQADLGAAMAFKEALLDSAFAKVRKELHLDVRYWDFCLAHKHWLRDWTLFASLKKHFNQQGWQDWPEEYRDRSAGALEDWEQAQAPAIRRESFAQYVFFRQWQGLREHCRSLGISLVGDAPIYVTHDSADVWAGRELFKLDQKGGPEYVAGVPPDYFSRTGQLWGNPVFAWQAHQKSGFKWWLARLGHNLALYDLVRLDHFRGFSAYWEVPAGQPTAENGQWVAAPGQDFLDLAARRFPGLALIAEDLGVIDAEVRELKARYGLPGMKILQFAFGDEAEKHAPHLHEPNCLAYTGTHDNNTARGWLEAEATPEELGALARYVGFAPEPEDAHRVFLRLAMASVAMTAMAPLQDVLALGAEHRMNTPGTVGKNWRWRLPRDCDLSGPMAELEAMTRFFNRA